MAAKRFTRDTWIALGLSELKGQGPSALTIDKLCDTADKTRGSFYFHFEAIEAFLAALAHDWHERFTTQIIATSTANTNRLDLLNMLVGRLDLELEAGIRQLTLLNGTVAEIVAEADHERLSWLAELYENSGSYTADQALAMARIEYAAFTGFKLIDPDMSPVQARKLYDDFLKFTGRA